MMTINTNTTIVRPAIPEESSGIENINKNAFPQDFICDWIFLSPIVSRYINYAIKANYFSHKYPDFFTAHCEDCLAGYFNIQTVSDRVNINYLAVDPQYQRKGVARKMLDYLEEECLRKINVKQINLQVNENNESGIKFYKSASFEFKKPIFLYLESLKSLPFKKCSFDVQNWLEAEAWQYTYGLSYLLLSIDGNKPLRIGRLGRDYWRVSDVDYLQDEGLAYALTAIDCHRKNIFIRTDQKISVFPNILVTFLGMEKSL